MIGFRETARQRLNDILVPSVGPGSDPKEYIRTFDRRLTDVGVAKLPFLVINVRTVEKLLTGEIGNPFQKYTWTAHIYYLDIELSAANYDIADQRRDNLMGRVQKTLEQHRFLDLNGQVLADTDTDGHREVVYDSSIQVITFDEGGQDDHQSFVSEMFLEIYTDRS